MATKSTAVAPVRTLSIAEIARMSKAERAQLLGVTPESEEGAPLVETIVAGAGKVAASVVNTFEGAPSAFMLAFRANRR